jgi:hypothetical protein
MKISLLTCTMSCACLFYPLVAASVTDEDISEQLKELEQRLSVIEEEAAEADADAAGMVIQPTQQVSSNAFNPEISVILEGVFTSYSNDPEDYNLPGFALGGEYELAPEGFSLGHSEFVMSKNVDDKFFAQVTLVVAEHEGQSEVLLEEAYFETIAMGNGFTLRGGRFYSALGYLNQQHKHVWDFFDAPLIYTALFGNQYFDDGLRLSYIVPADLFIELGTEIFAGNKFPASSSLSGANSWTAFITFGGDIGFSQSWQAGFSYWSAGDIERQYGGHSHDGAAEVPEFQGESDMVGFNAIYKWAPDGNYREQNLKLQFEYFDREDQGDLTLLNSSPLETSTLSSQQDGWYLQGIWQFVRTWSAGLRFDSIDSNNTGSNLAALDEAGLVASGHQPKRVSVMAQWMPSEYSRIRLQYAHDESYQVTDNQVMLQYTFSMGAHGAHQY